MLYACSQCRTSTDQGKVVGLCASKRAAQQRWFGGTFLWYWWKSISNCKVSLTFPFLHSLQRKTNIFLLINWVHHTHISMQDKHRTIFLHGKPFLMGRKGGTRVHLSIHCMWWNIKDNACRWLNQIWCTNVCNLISGANKNQVATWQSKIITIYSLNSDAKEGQRMLDSSSPAWLKKQQWSLVLMFVLLLQLSRILPHWFQSLEGQKGPLHHVITSPG